MIAMSIKKAAILFQINAGPIKTLSFGRFKRFIVFVKRASYIKIWFLKMSKIGKYVNNSSHFRACSKTTPYLFVKSQQHKLLSWFLTERYINKPSFKFINEQEERRAAKAGADTAGNL